MNKQEIEQYLNNLPLYTNYSKILTTRERLYIITSSELVDELRKNNIRESNLISFLTEKDINYPQNIDPKRIFFYYGLKKNNKKNIKNIQNILSKIFLKDIQIDPNILGIASFQKTFFDNTILNSLNDIRKYINFFQNEKDQYFFLKLLKSIQYGNTGFLINTIQKPQEKYIKNFGLIQTGDVVIFGGMNTTFEMTNILNRIQKRGFLFGFEPSKKGFNDLNSFRSLQNNFKIEKKVLGKENNKFIDFFDAGNDSVTNFGKTDLKNIQSIQLTSIDNCLNGNRVDLIWLSVNGDELNCLSGAKSSIKKFKPKIIIKLHPKNILDVLELLISLNKNYRFEFGYYDQKNFLDELYLYAVKSNC